MNDLKLLLIIILVNSATIVYAQTNESLDSLFYLNGNIELVNITKSTSYEIECTYPGETILSVISRSELWKIKFHTKYLQPIITQYFIDNKSEIWLLFLIAHSKR